jgi:NAD(P)-dependent dehydrogenase (short-subunit alcohol dehydrogenase family)
VRRREGARRVLVTGAASGIGAAVVTRLRGAGDRVAGVDRDRAALSAVELDARADADVSVWPELEAAVDACSNELGGLDAVVASAGIAMRGTAADTDLDDWERVFAVNARGVFLTARAAIPHLRQAGGGAIVNVASQLGLVAAANAAAYCASKGAVVQLTRAMAVDHGPEGIRVNCVCPGPTDTPLLEPYFAAAPDPSAEREAYERAQLHGRLVTPEEIAEAIAYLLSPAAGSTMGTALVVDGGYIIR